MVMLVFLPRKSFEEMFPVLRERREREGRKEGRKRKKEGERESNPHIHLEEGTKPRKDTRLTRLMQLHKASTGV